LLNVLNHGFRKEGVSNVVSLIMIAGIIISLLGMVFATYLPAWGKDIEVQTLNGMMDSFMDMKTGIDTLAVGSDPGSSYTTKFTLGSEGGPIFGFGRMSGSIELDDERGLVSVQDQFGTTYSQGRGALIYRSNTINVEDQFITLEAGAIIREQSQKAILKGSPNIVLRTDQDTGDLTLYMMAITIEGNDQSFSGTGSYLARTTLLSSQPSEYELDALTVISIEITTGYQSLWTDLFTEMAQENSLVDGVDYSISNGKDANGNPSVTLTLNTLDVIDIRTSIYQLEID